VVRTALALLLVAASVASAGFEVDWKDDYGAARKRAAESGRPLLLLFWAEW